jgi:hypothetical protein
MCFYLNIYISGIQGVIINQNKEPVTPSEKRRLFRKESNKMERNYRRGISKIFQKWWNGEELTNRDKGEYYCYHAVIKRINSHRDFTIGYRSLSLAGEYESAAQTP